MNHTLARARIVFLGCFLLFACLSFLFLLEPEHTGKATTSTTVNITNSSPIQCSTTVEEGRNTVSLPCITTAEPIAGIMNDSDIYAVYQYVPGTSDTWRVFAPQLPNYTVSDLAFLSRRAGYIVFMNGSATFSKFGLNVTSTNVPIAQGWSLVGYPSLTTKAANESFAPISNSFTEARTFDNPSSTFLVYFNITQSGTLNQTIPGKGYWINGTQGDTWTVTQ